jgi:hypothetical protein
MPYLTERKLSNTFDVPVNLPITEIKMGDWLLLATFKLDAPTRLTYRMMHLSFISSTVPLTNITAANKIVPNFGLLYVGLFLNYTSGDPSGLAALDVLQTDNLGIVERTAAPIVTVTPGTYSWLAVNNVQFSTLNSLLGVSDSADFTLSCVGQARVELDLSQ